MHETGEMEPLETIWEVPDDLWAIIEPLLNETDPPRETGRPRVDRRTVLNGILFRMRSGCQWNQLPERFGDDSTVHRYLQAWIASGIFQKIWAVLIQKCDALKAVGWEWQAADGMLGKARFGGNEIGPNPTDRAKNGTKKSLLVEAKGGPLSAVIAPANVHDTKLLEKTINAMVVERPSVTEVPQNMCLDKGFDNPTGREAVAKANYIPHIKKIGEEKKDQHGKKRFPARRWVVERTLAWLSKCRGILVRYEKKAENYLGLIQLACSLIWYRRLYQAAI